MPLMPVVLLQVSKSMVFACKKRSFFTLGRAPSADFQHGADAAELDGFGAGFPMRFPVPVETAPDTDAGGEFVRGGGFYGKHIFLGEWDGGVEGAWVDVYGPVLHEKEGHVERGDFLVIQCGLVGDMRLDQGEIAFGQRVANLRQFL